MRPSLSKITNIIKRHPVVSFLLTIIPVATLCFGIANFLYSRLIAEYRQKIEFSTERIQSLESEIRQLRREELAHQETFQNKIESTSDFNRPIKLLKGQPVYLLGGQWRLTLENAYTGLRNVTLTLWTGSERRTLDIYQRDRFSFVTGGVEYFVDIISIPDYESAEIVIIPKRQ